MQKNISLIIGIGIALVIGGVGGFVYGTSANTSVMSDQEMKDTAMMMKDDGQGMMQMGKMMQEAGKLLEDHGEMYKDQNLVQKGKDLIVGGEKHEKDGQEMIGYGDDMMKHMMGR